MGAGVVDAEKLLDFNLKNYEIEEPKKSMSVILQKIKADHGDRISELVEELVSGSGLTVRSSLTSELTISEILELCSNVGENMSDELLWLNREAKIKHRVLALSSQDNAPIEATRSDSKLIKVTVSKKLEKIIMDNDINF